MCVCVRVFGSHTHTFPPPPPSLPSLLPSLSCLCCLSLTPLSHLLRLAMTSQCPRWTRAYRVTPQTRRPSTPPCAQHQGHWWCLLWSRCLLSVCWPWQLLQRACCGGRWQGCVRSGPVMMCPKLRTAVFLLTAAQSSPAKIRTRTHAHTKRY